MFLLRPSPPRKRGHDEPEAARRPVASFLLLVRTATALFLGLALVAPQAFEPQSVRAAEVTRQQLNRDQFIALIEQLIRAGKRAEAERLLHQLPDDGPAALDKHFLLGQIAGLRGDWHRAEAHYRWILARDPNLHRVRLELARALFNRRNFDAADYHFRLVAAADVPEAVRRNIALFLDSMRQEQWWRASFQIAILPDSNINEGPNRSEVQIFGLPFQLSREAQETSGVGLQTAADVEIRPRIGARTRLGIGANLLSLDYQESQFDDVTLGLRMGPVFNRSSGEIGAFLTGARRCKRYSDSYGLRLTGLYDLNTRWQFNGAVTYLAIDNRRQDGLDGHYYGLHTAFDHALSKRSALHLLAGAARDDREDPAQANKRYRLGLGLTHELPWDLVGRIDLETHYVPFEAASFLFGKTRKDRLYRAEGRVVLPRALLPDLAPFLALAYERNESNIAVHDYDRIQGWFGFTKRF